MQFKQRSVSVRKWASLLVISKMLKRIGNPVLLKPLLAMQQDTDAILCYILLDDAHGVVLAASRLLDVKRLLSPWYRASISTHYGSLWTCTSNIWPMQANQAERFGFGGCQTNPFVSWIRPCLPHLLPSLSVPQHSIPCVGTAGSSRFLDIHWQVMVQDVCHCMPAACAVTKCFTVALQHPMPVEN